MTFIAGVVIGLLIVEYGSWDVDKDFPDQSPCDEVANCATFHAYVINDLKHVWNNIKHI